MSKENFAKLIFRHACGFMRIFMVNLHQYVKGPGVAEIQIWLIFMLLHAEMYKLYSLPW